MRNNYAPCFNRIDLVVILSYAELPWFRYLLDSCRLFIPSKISKSSMVSEIIIT